MPYLIKKLQVYSKKILSYLNNAFACTIAANIIGIVGIYLASQDLQISLKESILSPMPAWGTIILVLLLMVDIRLKSQSNSQNTSVKPKIDFIENGDLKWKVRLYPDGKFIIDDIPFCAEHDKFLYYDERGIYICFDAIRKDCKSHLIKKDYSGRIEYINALAEQKYRNI